MLSILKKQKGNLSVVMLLAVLGMASGLSLSSLVLRDFRGFFNQVERIQTQLMLRSETYRGQAYLTNTPFFTGRIDLPERMITVNSTRINRSYRTRSRIARTRENVLVGTEAGISTATQATEMDLYKLYTLVETSVGRGFGNHFDDNKTLVRRYGDLTLIQSSFSEFMYFSAMDVSPAGKNVYFDGEDLVTGKVHSNTDIWIKNARGGWPKFLNLVTTTGRIQSASGDYPKDLVFPGGLIEEYDAYDFPATAEKLKNGAQIKYVGGGDHTIYYFQVNGSSATGFTGVITSPQRKRAPVTGLGNQLVFPPYSFYPNDPGPYNPEMDTLYTNVFTVSDTIWSPTTLSNVKGKGLYFDGTLWLKGSFSGFQTWGSSKNLYLVDDIKLQDTALGVDPFSNRRDVVGIISEQSILVKYGYMDPADSLRHHPNCGSDSENYGIQGAGGGIWIYAAMCALGDGGTTNPRDPNFKDGVFTFEYQHPHPSTPSITRAFWVAPDSVAVLNYKWIDLHRRPWPPNSASPWPPNLDYPWYNPIWPERTPYAERGTINIFGAVAQRRRGFVHRSGNDSEYPSNSGVWIIEEDRCGGPIPNAKIPAPDPIIPGMVLQTINFPGASGSGVGYKKFYNFDKRFYTTQPLLFPEARLQGGKLPMTHGNWKISNPDLSIL